jgi:hypothetical protein
VSLFQQTVLLKTVANIVVRLNVPFVKINSFYQTTNVNLTMYKIVLYKLKLVFVINVTPDMPLLTRLKLLVFRLL